MGYTTQKNQGRGGREGEGNAERPERSTEVAREGCPGFAKSDVKNRTVAFFLARATPIVFKCALSGAKRVGYYHWKARISLGPWRPEGQTTIFG